jgi:hypothetical protein
MALSPMQTSLCNSMESQFDAIIAPIQAAKSGYQRALREFKSGIQSATYASQQEMNDALDALKLDTEAAAPGSSDDDMDELRQMLEDCGFLQGSNPAATVASVNFGLFDEINYLISQVQGAANEVFQLGKIANDLFNILEGVGIPGGSLLKELFEQADEIINCLAAICGRDVQDKIDTLDELVTAYNLNDSYEIDYSSIYAEAGLSADEIQSMTIAVEGIVDVNNIATVSIEESVSAVKALTKTGGFF